MTEIVNVRIRKRPRGTMGSTARDSIQMKSAPSASPRTIRPPTAGSVHSPACLLVRPTRKGAMAPAKTAAPM